MFALDNAEIMLTGCDGCDYGRRHGNCKVWGGRYRTLIHRLQERSRYRHLVDVPGLVDGIWDILNKKEVE
jgi:hypothetical protein